MRRKILTALMLVSLGGGLLTLVLLFVFQASFSQQSVYGAITSGLESVVGRIEQNQKQLTELKKTLRQDYLSRARAFALFVQNDPSVLEDEERLKSFCTDISARSLMVTDSDGYIRWGTDAAYIGFDLYSSQRTIPFLEVMANPAAEIVQEPAVYTLTGKLTYNENMGETERWIQYAAASLGEGRGIVILELGSERLNMAIADSRPENVTGDFTIGTGGYVFSVSHLTREITSFPDRRMVGTYFDETVGDSGDFKLQGQKMVYSAVVYEDMYLIAAVPSGELYTNRWSYLLIVSGIMLVLFAVFCFLADKFINETIIKGLKQTLKALQGARPGDFAVRTEVHTVPEFTALSTGINEMMETIGASMTENRRLISDLEEAKKEADTASAAKTIFLASVSHEIRTPMSGILGFSELALGETLTDRERYYFSSIRDSADELLYTINSILDFSKLETEKFQLESIPFRIQEALEVCGRTSAPAAEKKGIKLICGSANFPAVMGDMHRLLQVLVNLVLNAVKFTHEGVVRLSAEQIKENEEKITVRFSVSDSGIGMDEEHMKQIFQPFHQGDASTSRAFGGTGLGLAISYRLLKLMGAELVADSIPGVGSRFSFTLELPVSETQPESPAEAASPALSGTVLVCEDNEMNRLVVREHLRRVGLTAVIAHDGSEGVRIAQEMLERGEPPVIVFMDLHMPVMDGMTAAAAMTQLGVTAPIVAMTANSFDGDDEAYRKNGICGHITKPFSAEELMRVLRRTIDN